MSDTLVKKDIVKALRAKTGLSEKEATLALTSLVEVVTEALVEGKSVRLTDFGTFKTEHRKERKGRNPQDGKEIMIAATHVVKFNLFEKVKTAINKK